MIGAVTNPGWIVPHLPPNELVVVELIDYYHFKIHSPNFIFQKKYHFLEMFDFLIRKYLRYGCSK